MLEPAWIAETLGVKWSKPPAGQFSCVSVDSREITPGTLFVGINTKTGHRQAYTNVAAQAGAAGAIVEELQAAELPQLVVPDSTAALQNLAKTKRAEYKGKVIALTGSSGKTSAKELLAHLLGPQAYKTNGNFNNHYGVSMTILEAPMDAKFWVLEAGISTLNEMDKLAEIIQPDASFLTMIGSAHLEFLKTRENIAHEKGKLLHANRVEGTIVLHAPDAAYPALQNLKARVKVLAEGNSTLQLPKNYELQAIQLSENSNGWMLTLENETYALPLWTPGMAHNAALCSSLARELGVTADDLRARLKTWKDLALRGEWLRWTEGKARVYLDAYNSNPEAMADSLWRFERMSTSPARLYIIGTMAELGDESDALHRGMVANLPSRAGSRFIFMGAQAPLMAAELKKRGLEARIAENLENVKMILAEFDGDCFIKGSNSQKLYTLAELCSPL